MENRLIEINNNVSGWLKFAEAKNVVLIGFIGGAIFGILANLNNLPTYLKTNLLNFFIPAAIVSLTLTIFSFLPMLNKFYFKAKKLPKDINLLYFGHLRYFDKENLVLYIYHSLSELPPEPLLKFELDIAQQIIINSNIAWFKYQIFRYSVIIALIGLLTSVFFYSFL